MLGKTERVLSAAISATNAARDEFVEWDKTHQFAMVDGAKDRESAVQALRDYRQKRQTIAEAFAVAYSSLGAAIAILPLVEAGKEPEARLWKLLANGAKALEAAVDAVHAVRELAKENGK